MVKPPQKKSRFRRGLLLGALGLILLAIATPVFADTFDGFENYAAGTQNPFTWSFVPDSAPCWTGQVFTGTLGSNLINPFAGSNMYAMAFQNACAGTPHNTFLSETVNATANVVSFSVYVDVASPPITPSTDNFLLVMCSLTPVFTVNGTGAFTQLNLSAVRHWTVIAASTTATPGTTCSFSLKVSAVAGDVGPFTVAADNTLVSGANAVLSPSDIHLLSTPSGLPFNINPFNQSWVQVQYVTATSCGAGLTQIAPNACQQNYVPTSYVQMPLSGANLLTVRVQGGTSNPYYRSVIPTSTTDQVVYMDTPAQVVQFNFQITDVSGILGPGSSIYLQIGSRTITSGYLDAQGNFFAALVPQAYNLLIKSSSGTTQYSTTVNLQSASSVGPTNVPITITQFTKPAGSGFVQNLAYNLAWSCAGGSMIAFYSDTALATSQVKVTLYNQTKTGTFVVGSQSISGTIGQTQFTFNGILAADGTYFALFQATNSNGIQNLGPVSVSLSNPSCPSQFPSILPQLPNFPITVFGLDQILPAANGYSEIIALIIIVLTNAVFSARSSAIGGVVVAFEVLWFFLALFIPSSYTLIYTFIISSMVGFLRYRRTRTGLVGQ